VSHISGLPFLNPFSFPSFEMRHRNVRNDLCAFITALSMPLLKFSEKQLYRHERHRLHRSTAARAIAYSHRSDTMGSMFIARRAAIPQARNAITDKIRPTTAKLNGSCSFTPYI
jgi:hypothetical protein